MRSLPALIALYGVSLVFWGFVGGCRLIDERAGHVGRVGHRAVATVRAVALAVVLASLAGAVLTGLSLQPLTGVVALALVVLGGLEFAAGALGGVAVTSAAVAGILAWRRQPGHSGHSRQPGHSCQPGHSGATSAAAATGAPHHGPRIELDEVAVLVAAHNEQQTIHLCLDAVCRIVPVSNVYVASDGSTDDTAGVARARGCNVLDIQPNGGKARALATAIEHFGICQRYAAVLILDADAQLDPHYLERALPLFDDSEVAAVAGHADPKWVRHFPPQWTMLFNAYRIRLYRITQALLRYGQTWRHANVNFIVPGFASMYRCRALAEIDIAAPGLVIEDFNMTFELHRKRLGRVAYSPSVRCTSQEAYNLTEYYKQVRRWHLGFWQTVRRQGFWPGLFWLSLGVFTIEMLLQSLAFLIVPFVLAWLVLGAGDAVTLWLPQLGAFDVTLFHVAIGVFLADYVLTICVSALEKKPILLFYGLGFPALRWIDSFLFLYTLPLAFIEKSDGRWQSPSRI